MRGNFVTGYSRARALAYALMAGVFGILMTYVTARFAIGGGWFETLLLIGLTGGIWFAALRWYRRFRQLSASSRV
ncbi:MAG: hypothetical protein ACT4PJ_03060 [Gemmatimonadaceae bacterium]